VRLVKRNPQHQVKGLSFPARQQIGRFGIGSGNLDLHIAAIENFGTHRNRSPKLILNLCDCHLFPLWPELRRVRRIDLLLKPNARPDLSVVVVAKIFNHPTAVIWIGVILTVPLHEQLRASKRPDFEQRIA
jgi:hypothetical protein